MKFRKLFCPVFRRMYVIKGALSFLVFVTAFSLDFSFHKVYAGGGASIVLASEAAVIPRPIIALPKPMAIPKPIVAPIPQPILVPDQVLKSQRTGGSGKPIANNRKFNTKKSGEQAARRAGGNKKPDFHPNPRDGRGPHYHPKGSHDHYYVPKTISVTVKKGDSLSEIASKYGTTVKKIASDNGIANPNKIFPGQVLKINGKKI